MDRIIRTENGYLDLMSPVSNEVSSYDAAYPVELLSNGLKLKLADDIGTFRLSCPMTCDILFKKAGGEIRNGETSPG